MFYVIRNNEYLETEKLLFGDIEVAKKPHEKAIFINNNWVIDADSYFKELDKKEAQDFLKNTDWQIIRHKEQKELGVETSLTDDEYLELILQRQKRRNILNDITE